MVGSWVLWGTIILPTLYQSLHSKKLSSPEEDTIGSIVLLLQVILGGGILAAAPTTRSLLLNPLPPIVIGLMFYLFTYQNKDNKDLKKNPNTRLIWIAVSSFIATVGISQALYAVRRGNFTGASYSGVQPGTLTYNVLSFAVWAIVVVTLLYRSFHKKKGEGKDTAKTDAEIEKLKNKLGISGEPLAAFLPIILKVAALAAVAFLPNVQSILSTPYSPLIVVLVYLAVRYLKLIDDSELFVIAAVALIPQLQTLLKNPLPPIIILSVYMLLQTVGFPKDSLLRTSSFVGIFFSVIFQYLMDLIPTLLSSKGLNILTGSYTYANASWLSWILLVFPSMYYLFQARKPDDKRDKVSSTADLVILGLQIVSFFVLPLGLSNFRSLFLNVVPALAILLIWGFAEFVRFTNDKSPSSYNFLLGIIGVFSYLANTGHTMIGAPITSILSAQGIFENEVVPTMGPANLGGGGNAGGGNGGNAGAGGNAGGNGGNAGGNKN